ncbi:hypothetical protein L6164_021997 [Bauhinia variegata]|uniref:Uncharacterized protein n=1 Tax=Bauhinia variegata TaxID=167791 RepID=A0ACB9MF74_BAUVA|nr:hypothetical protein L6164_021997 [Bauhinia variegata]
MKLPTLFLVLLMLAGICMAENKRTFVNEMKKERFSVNYDDDENPGYGYGGSSVDNHHHIPRKDYNNHGGADDINADDGSD